MTFIVLVAAAQLAAAPAAPPPATFESCPVTLPPAQPFEGPSPATASRFWHGDESLAVFLETGGTWRGMGPRYRYRNKLFWWRRGYSGRIEPRPALHVTARRLDGDAPPAWASRATNARHADFGGWAMLVGLEFPTAGCPR